MATPILSILPATAQDNSYMTFTVTLSETSARDVLVDWRTVDGSAIVSLDYSGATGTVTIPAGETSASFSVYVYGNVEGEANEAFQVELSRPQNAIFKGAAPLLLGTGIIIPDDQETPGLFVSDITVVEGDGGRTKATFEIVLSQPSDERLSFAYSTVDGTAKAGSDYVAKSGVVTFKPGQTVATVEIDLRGDKTIEAAESFSLVVKPTDKVASAFEDAVGVATIVSDDGKSPVVSILPAESPDGQYMAFVAVLGEPSARDVVVEWRTADGTAVMGEDFSGSSGTLVIPAGETSARVSIYIYGDGQGETTEALELVFSNPQNAIFAGGAPLIRASGVIAPAEIDAPGLFVSDPVVVEGDSGTTTATFEIRLSEPVEETLSFRYTTVDGSARAGSDYVAKSGVVTFKAGQTVATVDVAIRGDKAVEAAESFSLVVKPTDDVASGFRDAVGEALIVSNDGAAPIISVQTASAGDGQYVTFTALLSKPSTRDVAFDWRTVDGEAKAGQDFSATSGTVTIAAGQTSAVFSVYAYGNVVGETNEAFQIELSDPRNAAFATGASLLRATGIIRQDGGDAPGLSVSDLILKEGDAGTTDASFQLTLSQAFDETLSFRFATVDGTAKAGSDYVATSGVVTFKAGQTVATVDVGVLGDGALENSESFSLSVRTTGDVTNGEGRLVGVATIVNDDTVNERLAGNDRDNLIRGGDGNDRIEGNGGKDKLFGDAGADTLFGGEGNDRLIGGAGRDVMQGDGGADVFVFLDPDDSVAGKARDVILGFTRGEDKIDLSAIDANEIQRGNQKFRFVGDDAFDGAGQLRFAKGVLSGDVDGDGQADFSIAVSKIAALGEGDFVL